MKRLGLFSMILAAVILAFYMQPVLFPPKLEPKKNQDQQVENQMTTWKYQELKSTGFSTYVGQPIEQLEKDFGKSYDRLASGFGFEIRYYRDAVKQLSFEANVQNGQVEAVKVLKPDIGAIAPFFSGMTMQDLSAITTIYTNFTFDYEDTEVGIELMEEDMNYRPLIAFDNGTFAILFFDQTTGKLFSIAYLSKDSLLKLLPYQVFGEGLPHYSLDDSADWETINRAKERKSANLLNMLREEDQLPIYKQSLMFSVQTRLLLHDFLTKPENILSEERLKEWRTASDTGKTTVKFSLAMNELDQLINKQDIQQATGIFTHPVIDPTFSLLLLYSDPYNHDRFTGEDSSSLGIAFSKENMLVLLQEEKKESSDSSDRQ
ncbi:MULTISPECIES: CAP-associated domain-containing protein [unclassified Enterococcus]|uniref:CAP-associated domain-containing protein n=1 Tax=unclassified Enterococcus TaxID=2608891 RepID=UPI0013EB03DD|nr:MULTISPECIES: CAP-associated domain-containing protein [unclassified Enterococcus]